MNASSKGSIAPPIFPLNTAVTLSCYVADGLRESPFILRNTAFLHRTLQTSVHSMRSPFLASHFALTALALMAGSQAFIPSSAKAAPPQAASAPQTGASSD